MENKDTYWSENIAIIKKSLVMWSIVSFGFGLLLVEPLNAISLGGYKLGFWFAQQGAMYAFLGLIFWYGAKMNKLDIKYDEESK